MQYPISLESYGPSLMVDLLSSNRQGRQAFQESGHELESKRDLCQAFGTAEAAFKAIPDETIPVLVPYGDGKDMLRKLQFEDGSASLLQELQPYTVSISQGQCKELLGGVLYSVLDGAALAVQEAYYDSEHKGLSLTKSD